MRYCFRFCLSLGDVSTIANEITKYDELSLPASAEGLLVQDLSRPLLLLRYLSATLGVETSATLPQAAVVRAMDARWVQLTPSRGFVETWREPGSTVLPPKVRENASSDHLPSSHQLHRVSPTATARPFDDLDTHLTVSIYTLLLFCNFSPYPSRFYSSNGQSGL